MFSEFANYIYDLAAKIPFDTLVWIVWGSYLAVFGVALLLTLFVPRCKSWNKRPFLCFTNAYAAVNAALFLIAFNVEQALFSSAVFWVAGYVLYGLLCALSSGAKRQSPPVPRQQYVTQLPVAAPAVMPQVVPAAIPQQPLKASRSIPEGFTSAVPAGSQTAKTSVRLEHAVSVTDKLLAKNLGKSDRQELEKLKNTLAVLQIKGTLSPAESEILNENFNTLLKLMAKYNV